MMHGEIRRALLEIRYRVAADFHHLFDQRVGSAARLPGVVHEDDLCAPPLAGELITLLGSERLNLERLYTLLPLDQLVLGSTRAASLAYCVRVLGPVLRAQLLGSPLPRRQVPRDRAKHDDGNDDADDCAWCHDLNISSAARTACGQSARALRRAV